MREWSHVLFRRGKGIKKTDAGTHEADSDVGLFQPASQIVGITRGGVRVEERHGGGQTQHRDNADECEEEGESMLDGTQHRCLSSRDSECRALATT